MGIGKTIPQSSLFVQTLNIFEATFNTPTLGRYNFGIPANTDVSVLKLTRASVYLIQSYSLSATVGEADFLESINIVPQLFLRTKINAKNIYKKPLPQAGYFDGVEAIGYFLSPQGDDELLLSCTGVLNQIAAMVGISSIKIQTTLNIQEIVDTKWINQFHDRTANKEGYLI